MRILFIGNSHTYYNDMPYQFAEIMRASGQQVEITMLTRGGQNLSGHIRNEQTRFNIRYGQYDFVIFQEVTSEFPDADTYLRDVSTLKGWCDEAGSACGLYMNFESPCDTPPLARMQPTVLSTAQTLKIPAARVGEAFAHATMQLPELDLYASDRHHASAAGSYLIALTIAHDLFGLSVRGLPIRIVYRETPILSLDEATAAALQTLVETL